jgi:hypothetical protein
MASLRVYGGKLICGTAADCKKRGRGVELRTKTIHSEGICSTPKNRVNNHRPHLFARKTHHFPKPSQRSKKRLRRLPLPINLIQHKHKLLRLLPGIRSKALGQQHRKRTNMLAPALSELLPLVLEPPCLQRRPKDLCQQMATRDTLRAPNNGVRHRKGGEDGADDC